MCNITTSPDTKNISASATKTFTFTSASGAVSMLIVIHRLHRFQHKWLDLTRPVFKIGVIGTICG